MICRRQVIRIIVLFYTLSFLYLLMWFYTIENHDVTTVQFNKETVIKSGKHLNDGFKVKGVHADAPLFNLRPSWKWNETDYSEIQKIFNNSETFCGSHFIGYDSLFALLKGVIIVPNMAKGRAGGERITDVLNQNENDEFFSLTPGYFMLPCEKNDSKSYTFTKKNHLNVWIRALKEGKTESILKDIPTLSQWTIAVQRYEYANLYHTMTDYYNAFLLANVFQLQPDNITILWIDGHPVGALDDSWTKLFGKVLRAGEIEKPLQFDNMLWGIMGYDSPLNHHNRKSVSYLEEFRRFFLTRHGVSLDTNLNCDNLTVTFLWRRNYLAHPRNPSGSVSRKIKNEDELLSSVKTLLPQHNVVGLQIDKLPMDKQLLLMSQTDILIGMHGAGLSHTLFLPSHGGLVELYPNYWPSSNQHFRAMAKWRHLEYLSWSNTDRTKELSDKYTIVDVDAVVKMVSDMKVHLCN